MRRLPLIAVSIVSLGLMAGCGSNSTAFTAAPAATVNDVDIPASAVYDQLDAIADVPSYGAGGFGVQDGITGSASGTYDTSAVATVLNTLVIFELVAQEVDERGLEVTAEDLAAADQQVESLLAPSNPLDPTAAAGAADADTQVSEAARQGLVEGIAAFTVLQTEIAGDVAIEEVTDEQVAEFYEQNPDAVGGAAFEEVEGEIRAALEEQAAQQAQEAAQEPFSRWLREALLAADVVVDPRFGRWTYIVAGEGGGIEEVDDAEEAESAGVLPPEGPEAPSTTVPPGVEPLVPAPG